MRTTINFSPAVLQGAKKRAELQGVTLSSFVEDAVRAAVIKAESASEGAAVSLPVFDCGGPPLVDLDDKDAVGELFDAGR